MGEEGARNPAPVGALRKRREAMADGRYLIYFTFEGEAGAPPPAEEGARPEPEAEEEEEEGRRV